MGTFHIGYWAAVSNEQKLRIEMLEDALRECKCELNSIHHDRVRADKMTMLTLQKIDKVLDGRKEAE